MSYRGLTDARMRASGKDLPVQLWWIQNSAWIAPRNQWSFLEDCRRQGWLKISKYKNIRTHWIKSLLHVIFTLLSQKKVTTYRHVFLGTMIIFDQNWLEDLETSWLFHCQYLIGNTHHKLFQQFSFNWILVLAINK